MICLLFGACSWFFRFSILSLFKWIRYLQLITNSWFYIIYIIIVVVLTFVWFAYMLLICVATRNLSIQIIMNCLIFNYVIRFSIRFIRVIHYHCHNEFVSCKIIWIRLSSLCIFDFNCLMEFIICRF